MKRKNHSLQDDVEPKRSVRDEHPPKVALSQGASPGDKHAVVLPDSQEGEKFMNHRDFAHEFHNAVLETTNRQNKTGETIFSQIESSKITRVHYFTLAKEQSRLYVKRYSFSRRTFNVWNKLSTGCLCSVTNPILCSRT